MAKAHTQSRLPDITPGVPIPEFVPGPEPEHVKTMRAILRLWRWSFGAILLLYLVVLTLRPGIAGRFMAMGVAMFFWLLPLLIIRPKQTVKKHQGDPWSVPLGLQIQYQAGVLLMVLSITMIAYAGDGVFDLLYQMSIYIAIGGVGLVVAGRFVRQPGPISCIDCSYPLVGLMIPCQCPECGQYILGPGHTTDRPRVKSPWFLWGGLAMMVFGLTMTTLRFTNPGLLYAPVPRAVLLKLAPTDRDAFNQLMKSPTSPEQEQQLIHSMVSARTGFSTGSSYEQEAWFGAKIMQGALGADELDGLFMPATQSRIKAPSTAQVGEPVRLLIEADHRRTPSGTAVMYYLEGFRIGDAPTPHAGSTAARYRDFLSSPEDPEYIDKGYVPMYTWTPTEPGAIIIRARLVFVLAPGTGTRDRIDWSAQGDARFPAPPLWTHEIELTHTIEVTP